MRFRYHNLLNPRPTAISTEGFSAPEHSSEGPSWLWGLGPISRLRFPEHDHAYIFSAEIGSPLGLNQVRFSVNGKEVHEVRLEPGEKPVPVRIEIPSAGSLHISYSAWNSGVHPWTPDDERPIAACYSRAEIYCDEFARRKICPMPFQRMELTWAGTFVPCCPPWLATSYFEIQAGSDHWNGPAAHALRESILNGSYEFCRRELCHTRFVPVEELSSLSDPANEFHLGVDNLEAMRRGETEMPDRPNAITVSVDPRCNLACPSCRMEKITKADSRVLSRISSATQEIERSKARLMRLRISGDGEALFSPFLRGLIKQLTPAEFPLLRITELHSNGLLLTEATFEALQPGAERINRLLISVDAGDAETYLKVRGGDWNTLVTNLRWAGTLRKAGRFESFLMLFVYRRENFRTMGAFVQLATEVGADGVVFSPLLEWGRMGISDYSSQAVHLPANSEHAEFLSIKEALLKAPGVSVSI